MSRADSASVRVKSWLSARAHRPCRPSPRRRGIRPLQRRRNADTDIPVAASGVARCRRHGAQIAADIRASLLRLASPAIHAGALHAGDLGSLVARARRRAPASRIQHPTRITARRRRHRATSVRRLAHRQHRGAAARYRRFNASLERVERQWLSVGDPRQTLTMIVVEHRQLFAKRAVIGIGRLTIRNEHGPAASSPSRSAAMRDLDRLRKFNSPRPQRTRRTAIDGGRNISRSTPSGRPPSPEACRRDDAIAPAELRERRLRPDAVAPRPSGDIHRAASRGQRITPRRPASARVVAGAQHVIRKPHRKRRSRRITKLNRRAPQLVPFWPFGTSVRSWRSVRRQMRRSRRALSDVPSPSGPTRLCNQDEAALATWVIPATLPSCVTVGFL